jgi:Mrp family chromosome partitioning ATPase/capsular polysaccharide biosynthesis protein
MAEPGPADGVRVLERFLPILRRRWWVILVAIVVAATAAALIERSHDEDYVASSDVYLTRLDLSRQLVGVGDQTLALPVERWVQTQAELARVPAVAVAAVRSSKVPNADAGALLGASSVTPHTNADLLTFAVRDPDPQRAALLAGAYAAAFVDYRRDLDKASVQSAIDDVDAEIDAVTPPRSDSDSALLFSLTAMRSRLRGVKALQTSNVMVVRAAGPAGRQHNEPLQAAAAGGGLGLVAGLAVALLLEAMVRRVRTESEVSQRLGLPVLARLPARSRQRRPSPGLAMRDRVDSPEAEIYRAVRASVELAATPDLRTIMVCAVDGEIADTPVIAANLAIALARTSNHTILVDLDLRRTALDDLFAARGRPGVTEVVAGWTPLDAALITAWAGDPVPFGASSGKEEAMPDDGALLQLLPAGARPASVGDLVASPRLEEVLATLEQRASVVVLHGPPLVGTADVMSLADGVDGLIVVAGLDQVRRDVLDAVHESLDGVIEGLGVIVISPRKLSKAALRRGGALRGSASKVSRRARRPRRRGRGIEPQGIVAQPMVRP